MGKKKKNEIPSPLLVPQGFSAAAMVAGIKASGKPDLSLIVSDRPATVAGVFTTNRFAAPPVSVCRDRLAAGGKMRGVIVNAGNANACTGAAGKRDAERMAAIGELATGCPEGSFMVASTGVIGHRLPMDKINANVGTLAAQLTPEGFAQVARAIMTTDLVAKVSQRSIKLPGGGEARILGLAKGSGMIEPNMATMLSFIVTDYPLRGSQAQAMLMRACGKSFNAVTVDSDTSTNDTLLMLANGAACPARATTAATHKRFETALAEVCTDLARAIAADGEGATKLISIEVTGTKTEAEAYTLARSIANSPLVKTGLYGNDPNWGRIAMALGKAGVAFDPEQCQIRLQGVTVMRGGRPVAFDEKKLSKALKVPEVTITARVGKGKSKARVWTCDMSYDYVRINAEYTT